jgi:hypothetical protein
MLLLFWIPILLRESTLDAVVRCLDADACARASILVALLWAFAHGVRIAMHSVRTMGPLRALLRL